MMILRFSLDDTYNSRTDLDKKDYYSMRFFLLPFNEVLAGKRNAARSVRVLSTPQKVVMMHVYN